MRPSDSARATLLPLLVGLVVATVLLAGGFAAKTNEAYASEAYSGQEKGNKKCNDGIDNDGDGLIDGDDPDCQGDGGGGQGGGGKKQNVPVTVTFRDAGLDGIQSDGLGAYAGVFTKRFGRLIFPDNPSRTLQMSFGQLVGSCELPQEPEFLWSSGFPDAEDDADVVVNRVVENNDGTETDPDSDFLGMVVGTMAPARVKINFDDPDGRTLLWTVRYKTIDFPCSTNVYVSRLSDTTWSVETIAGSRDRATLVMENEVEQGTYYLPFRMVVSCVNPDCS